ncbi:MAG: amidophosphoribosyltransferase [Verrucomicrobiales bacterium]|nr:amidophosphoribosyltransferase [Verrucomicrobiales bacterium]
MSDPIRHECGIALVRLRKPLEHYYDKYHSALWGYQKLYALMAKQRNRGQDGTGIGCCKLGTRHGQPYMFRQRSVKKDSLNDMFDEVRKDYVRDMRRTFGLEKGQREARFFQPDTLKENFDFGGQILMGHLRYGTSGSFGKGACHPYLRRSNWPTRSLMVLGNFNMTNTAELHRQMIARGQHPVYGTDTQTVLEEIGFQLDELHTDIYRELRDHFDGSEIPEHISEQLDMVEVIRRSAAHWDGGYAIAGVVGNGDVFVMRDPHGIRPCFFYEDDEVFVFASERAAIRTVFDAAEGEVRELPPGQVAVMKASGEKLTLGQFAEPGLYRPCSFERIYFSRGNDATIYAQRKALGGTLVPQFLEATDNDLANTVVSFIPNTAETAYHGLMDALRMERRQQVKQSLLDAWERQEKPDETLLDDLILRNWPRAEKIAHKDVKLRTFISQEGDRDTMASMVYDITYGVVKETDSLVVVDDSIVRGTTLRKNLLRILARTLPKQIIVMSTAPQIRYPDCYGIDMAEIGKFIAFEAAIDLARERFGVHFLDDLYRAALAELEKAPEERRNVVQDLYAPFTDEDLSTRISAMVRPSGIGWDGEVRVIYQTIEGLHRALGETVGDWYFSGNYPTPGGIEMVNRAFIHFIEKKSGRAYDLI